MCGIAGFCNLGLDWDKEIKKMNDVQADRGPNGEGIYHDENYIALGHRRLSIFDLSNAGAQPMISHSGRYVMSYNGEIYNFKEIAKSLYLDGYKDSFSSESDTEVLLEAFDFWGVEKTLEQLQGMFGIALYNIEEKKLVLIRDRMGEKPLYYGFVGKSFSFASNLKAILSRRGADKTINRGSVKLFFDQYYIPAPYTICEKYMKLQPGEMLTIQYPFEQYKLYKYYDLDQIAAEGQKKPIEMSLDEAAEVFEEKLVDVISKQMKADVPVGIFLSGGIDSSLISALASKVMGKQVTSFTVGFKNSAVDEAKMARKTAELLGIKHELVYLDENTIFDSLFKLPKAFNEPFANQSGVPAIAISECAKRYATVMLGGDGGDELFAGYDYYWHLQRWWNIVRKTPKLIRKAIVFVGSVVDNDIYKRNCRFFSSDQGMDLFAEQLHIGKNFSVLKYDEDLPYIYSEKKELFEDLLSNLMLQDEKGCLPDCSCVKGDCSGMNVGLELRSPLLDKEIVEFAWSLPPEYKYSDGYTKQIMRKVLYKYIPREIVERPKQPFWFPVEEWLRKGKMVEWVQQVIDSRILDKYDFLDGKEFEHLWKEYLNNHRWDQQIWATLMLVLWCEENI